MKNIKPCCLTKVWTLSADLKGKPLVAEALLNEGREAQFVRGIILVNEVLKNSAALP